MSSPATLLILASLLPLVSFLLLLCFGRRFGDPFAGILATLFLSGAFICSILAMISWLNVDSKTAPSWGAGIAPLHLSLPWVPIGPGLRQDHPGYLDIGLYLDSLTIVLFSMITLVATLVHIFSIGYLRGDPRFHRFFALLGLFCFSMLSLVLSSTLLQIFVFWELVGLCSYLLIGFWSQKPTAANAALKAFLVNRVADLAFLAGIALLVLHLGNTSLPHLWALLSAHSTLSPSLLTIIGLCLVTAALAKSAQFPFHLWLPDAMEAPSPVSALIHAATMVAAGVYLLARLFPILTPDVKLLLALLGGVSLALGALVALAQTDIKRLLAFSTISQLGLMVLGLAVGSWTGALFHLVTHAFAKALLFLAAGSIIYAASHEQELTALGGLARKIPVTALTFLVGLLSLSGFHLLNWGFAGFYSKELIFDAAARFSLLARQAGHPELHVLFVIPALVAYLTPFYLMRCWMLAFTGRPRDPQLNKSARETPLLYIPLLVLMALVMIAGKSMSIRELLEQSQVETARYTQTLAGDPSFDPFAASVDPSTHTVLDASSDPLSLQARAVAERFTSYAWPAGLLGAMLFYSMGFALPNLLLRLPGLRAVYQWLHHRLYLDELAYFLFLSPVRLLARLVDAVDRYFLDPLLRGLATLTQSLAMLARDNDQHVLDAYPASAASAAHSFSAVLRIPQAGHLRSYLLYLLAALVLATAATLAILLLQGL